MASSSDASIQLDAGRQLNAWSDEFATDVKLLSYLLSLRTRPDDYASRDAMEPTLSRMSSRLSQLECAIDYIRSRLNFQRMQNEQFQQLRLHIHSQQQRIPHIRAHLPTELKPAFSKAPPLLSSQGTAPLSSKRSGSSSPFDNSDYESNPPLPSPTESAVDDDEETQTRPVTTRRPSTAVKTRPPPKSKGRPPNGRPPNGSAKAKGAASSKQVNSKKSLPPNVVVRSVTTEELNSAPQYVRGRLTVEKIATVSSRLSEIATSKYTLIKKPNSSLTSAELSHCMDFQQADCEDTAGYRVLTDNDIKAFGNYRIDSTVKTAINVLRHVGILKEVRGKNNVRILIINETD